jgi:hypothetical protein
MPESMIPTNFAPEGRRADELDAAVRVERQELVRIDRFDTRKRRQLLDAIGRHDDGDASENLPEAMDDACARDSSSNGLFEVLFFQREQRFISAGGRRRRIEPARPRDGRARRGESRDSTCVRCHWFPLELHDDADFPARRLGERVSVGRLHGLCLEGLAMWERR